MKKALHVWGISRANTGDFLLGPATRDWFIQNVANVQFSHKSCRDIFDVRTIQHINASYDYLVVGGGGLILPDTNPNKVSCWQWTISSDAIRNISIPIYVVSLGYNLFYNQTVCMPNRDNSEEDYSRLDIFNTNITTLIEKAEYFSVRHNGDLALLAGHIPKSLQSRLTFQFCPTIDYAKNWLGQIKNAQPSWAQYLTGRFKRKAAPLYALEIKEDRAWRRYHATTKEAVFEAIYTLIQAHPGVTWAVLLHEPTNAAIYNFLTSKGLNIKLIRNYNRTETQIFRNFLAIDRLYCMAGHSQMIAHALGCDVRSIITHQKLRFFLEDTGNYTYEKYIDPNRENVRDKLLETF